MSKYLILLFLICWTAICRAQGTDIKACVIATKIAQTVNYCSAVGDFNNINVYKYTWFQFTSTAFDVTVTASGAGSGETLQAPVIDVFTDCSGTELVGTTYSANNITSLSKGGLVAGNTYYIEVTGANNRIGTFELYRCFFTFSF